ncbi:MAG: MerR family transcriptional regulator [Nocardioides sp.]
MKDERMRIGEFAAAAGVSVDAVRFYERRGLLHRAPRTTGGYRTFDRQDLDRVQLARQLQHLGLTVSEVVDALAAHDSGDATCDSERWRLEAVETRIEAQLAELRRTRRVVRDALAACEAGHCRLATSSPAAQL